MPNVAKRIQKIREGVDPNKSYGLDISSFGLPLIAIYLMSDIGSVTGGWMSSTLIKRGV